MLNVIKVSSGHAFLGNPYKIYELNLKTNTHTNTHTHTHTGDTFRIKLTIIP